MMAEGQFERVGADPAPVEGRGSLGIEAEGVHVQAETINTRMVVALSALAAALVMVVAVFTSLRALDHFDLVTDGDSLKPVVAAGIVGFVGTFLISNATLRRILPRRRLEHLIPFRCVASASLETQRLVLVSTSEKCLGRITLASPHAEALLADLRRLQGH
jgi:hypothetical protein